VNHALAAARRTPRKTSPLRPRRRRLVALLGALATFCVCATAAAGPRDPFAWVDADAPVVASLDPASLPTLLTTAGADGSALLGLAGETARPIDTAGLEALGVDPDRPIALGLGAIDGPRTSALFEQLADARVWNDQLFRELRKTYWRNRLVIPVGDRKKARAAAERLATRTDALLSVATDEARSIAMVFGAHPKRADAAVKALRARGVLALGWERDSRMLIALRLPGKGDVLVVDAVRPFGGVPIVWERNRREVFGLLDRAAGTGNLRPQLEPGPGPGAALRLWLRGEQSLTAMGALARRQILFAVAAADRDRGKRRTLVARGRQQLAACKRFDSLAGRGSLRSLAFAIDAGDDAIEIDLRGARRETRPAIAVRDDGLWAALDGAPWAAALHTASLTAARRAPRAEVLRDADELRDATVACGAGATLATLAFAGPGLAYLAADALATGKPIAKLVAKARNAAWFRANGGVAAIVSLPRNLRRRARKAARNSPHVRTVPLPDGLALAVGDPDALAWLSPKARAGRDDDANDDDADGAVASGDENRPDSSDPGSGSPGGDTSAPAEAEEAVNDVTPLVRFAVRSRAEAPPWLASLLGPVWGRTVSIEGSVELRREVRARVRLMLRRR